MRPSHRRLRTPATPALITGALIVVACGARDARTGSDVTGFEGATLITGDGGVIENAVFVVEDDRFTMVGPAAAVTLPSGIARVDLTGRTVMPAIVNAHVHLSSERAERARQLRLMAYYGAGTVVSLGLDSGDVPFQMRGEAVPDGARVLTAGRGITAPEPGRSEVPFWVETEEEARAAVRELAARDVDIVKIWVDDRGGRYEELSPDLSGAVVDEAHQHGLKVTAHVFYLADAKSLLGAGIDAFAHGIRDQDVDDEVIGLWRDRPDVVLVPNLPNPGVPVDLAWLSGTLPPAEMEQMREGNVERPEAQESFGIQARNLARLEEAGVRIAFGTDGSTVWAPHFEMEDMVRSGMTPSQVIVAATGTSAELMGLADVGVIAPGHVADFVVLDANPLDDITNTRRISDVYLRGTAIDREAIAAGLAGDTP